MKRVHHMLVFGCGGETGEPNDVNSGENYDCGMGSGHACI